MNGTFQLEHILRHDRVVVLLALAGVVILAAAYTIIGVGMEMSALSMTRMAIEMPGMVMLPAPWTVGYATIVLLMWWMMMIAMMVPSATPTILLFASVVRKQEDHPAPFLTVSVFLSGYLIIWSLFSAVATLLQWVLQQAGLVDGMMEFGAPVLAGAILIGAGLYQLTPLKLACLKQCQHPFLFVMHNWRPGKVGALKMGLLHGTYCLGCCWLLMSLLFVGGVMNLLWIAGLALYVALEKLAEGRRVFVNASAVILVGSGVWLIGDTFLST